MPTILDVILSTFLISDKIIDIIENKLHLQLRIITIFQMFIHNQN